MDSGTLDCRSSASNAPFFSTKLASVIHGMDSTRHWKHYYYFEMLFHVDIAICNFFRLLRCTFMPHGRVILAGPMVTVKVTVAY